MSDAGKQNQASRDPCKSLVRILERLFAKILGRILARFFERILVISLTR
jgi:hypothetical protein